MATRPADVDAKQSMKDIFFTSNRYKLDDRFVIRDGKKHPFAILVPGGGYSLVCSFIEGVPIARKLNQQGISAFIVYYRVKKKAAFPAPMDDLATAVKEIFSKAKEYNLDTENYSVWGASAGGHLTASFGTEHMVTCFSTLVRVSSSLSAVLPTRLSWEPMWVFAGSMEITG